MSFMDVAGRVIFCNLLANLNARRFMVHIPERFVRLVELVPD